MTTLTITQLVTGRGLGSQLGFPTLNFAIPSGLTLEPGSYAARLVRPDHESDLGGVLFWGSRATLGDPAATLEFHAFDSAAAQDYARAPVLPVQLVLGQRLRPVQRFTDLAALRAAIQSDIEIAQTILTTL